MDSPWIISKLPRGLSAGSWARANVHLRVLTGLATDLITFGELPLSPGCSLAGGREAVGVLQKVKMSKKHFDWALEQYFQAEKVQTCPQFCPLVASGL